MIFYYKFRMLIYITTDLWHVRHDFHITNIYDINPDDDNVIDGYSTSILVLHTSNYQIDLPKYNVVHGESHYETTLKNTIKDIIKNESHLIVNYNLEYMINRFYEFKDLFAILFKLNP